MRRFARLSTGALWNSAVAATLVASAAATLRGLGACWRIELLGGFSYGIVVTVAFAALFLLLHRAAARAAPGDRLPYADARLGRRTLVAAFLLGRAAVFGAMLAVAMTSFFGPIARPRDRLLLDFDRPLHMGPYREALLERAVAVWHAADGARTGDAVLDGLLTRAAAGADVMSEVFERVRALPPLAVRIQTAETALQDQHRARLVVVSARTPGEDIVWGRLRRYLRYEWFCVGGLGGTAVDEVRPAVLRLPNDPIVDRNARLTVDLPPAVRPTDVEVRMADRPARLDGYSRGGERVQVGFACPLPREVEQVPIEVLVDGRKITSESFALARGYFAVDDRIGLRAWPALAEIFGPDCAMRPPLGDRDVAWVDAAASLPVGAVIAVVRGEVVRREPDSRLLPRPALVSSAYGRAGVWLASGTEELPHWRSAAPVPGEVLVAIVDAQGHESVVVASPGPGLVTVVLPPDKVLSALPTKQQRALARLMLLATGVAHRGHRGDESVPVLRLDLDLDRKAAEQLQAGPGEVADSLTGQLWHLLGTDTPGGAYTPDNTIRPHLAWILFGLLALLVGPFVTWRACAAFRGRSA